MQQGETGLEEVLHNELNVFPNPAKSNEQIYFSKLIHCNQLEINDLTGKRVWLDEAKWSNQSYHLPSLIPGSYHVRILTNAEPYIFRLNVFDGY